MGFRRRRRSGEATLRRRRRRRPASPPLLGRLLCLAHITGSAVGFLIHASTTPAAITTQNPRSSASTTTTLSPALCIEAAPTGAGRIPRAPPLLLAARAKDSSPAAKEEKEGEDPPPPPPPKERTKLRGKLPIISRTVPLGIFLDGDDEDEVESGEGGRGDEGGREELSATVWEVEHPSEMMEMWWSSGATDKEKIGDPFGVVMWPGSILAAKEMARHRDEIEGMTVLLLGAGTGLEAQAAAMLGARKVIATDINKLTLKLLDFGAEKKGLGSVIQSKVFDLFSEQDLPECDVVVAADILYNEMLGAQMGLRCTELLGRDEPPKIIVTDSQRFAGTDFLPFVNKVMDNWGEPRLSWEETVMEGFTGSGMLIEGDQTYDVMVRMLSIGWKDER